MAKKQSFKILYHQLKDSMVMAMNYNSNVVIGIEHGLEYVNFVRITASGIEHDSMSRESFLREFYRDLLQEEWVALIKFWTIAMGKPENDERAIALLERLFTMKIKELEGKEMSELVSMHNDLAKANGKPAVATFKSVEAAKIAIVKMSNEKAKPKAKSAKATGKGVEGRPRTGVGKFSKDQLAKGKSNADVLALVKKEFPKNSTTLSCIAYYRAHMVKDGTLKATPKKVKPKAVKGQKQAAKPAKAAKAAKVVKVEAKDQAEATA